MNVKTELLRLLGEINDGLAALSKMENFIVDYECNTLKRGSTGQEQALALSQALANYYTCLETIFLRISQFFENSLPGERWHQTLLDNMMIEIPSVRPAVLTRQTRCALRELLRFRHFSRYYYAVDYDWDKLCFLLVKFNAVRNDVKSEIKEFTALLEKISLEA